LDVSAQLRDALSERYRIDREIGAGGMATVYLAEDVRHRRRVALKVLRPELAAVLGPERFLSEINVTANLQHPHLLPLFDSGEVNGLLWYVMPYVEGESLRDRLERERQLPVDEAVRIAVSIASALDYAHRHGVIHRDLKPENILLHDGQPLVADFGIALAISNAGGARVTQTGLSLGTPQYMSPEQATGDRVIDARSDVYSLAAVLYEMLAGDPPHASGTTQGIIAKLLTERPVSVRTYRSNVPEHVDAAVMCALEKLPADRFASAGEFAEALTGARTVTRRGISPAVVAVRTRRERVVAAVPWVVAIGALLTAGWIARPNAKVEQPGVVTRFTLLPPEGVTIPPRTAFTVSPDGRHIAYIGVESGGRALYVRSVDDLEARKFDVVILAAGMGFFSADGESLVFSDGAQLRRIGLSGGASTPLLTMQGGATGDWSSEGRIVIARERGLWLLDENGGEPVRLTQPDTTGPERHALPRFLPDGSAVLFSVYRGTDGEPDLELITLSGERTVIAKNIGSRPTYVHSGHIITSTREGSVIALPFDLRRRRATGPSFTVLDGVAVRRGGLAQVDVSSNGTLAYIAGANLSRLVLVDRNGKAQVLTPEERGYRRPRASPDGNRIVVEVKSGGVDTTDLWMYDRAGATFSRFTFGGGEDPAWTRDGLRVAFAVRDPDERIGMDIHWQRADGSAAAEVLLSQPGRQYPYAFTPGDTSLIYDDILGTNGTDVRDVNIATDSTRGVLTTPFMERLPALSPNGRWLTYTSDESGTVQVYARPFPGPGAKIAISSGFGDEPTWSTDGSEIFYRDASSMIAVRVRTTPQFTIESRRTLFVDRFVRASTLSYDVHPDGQHFVMLESATRAERFVIVTNWAEELRAAARPKR